MADRCPSFSAERPGFVQDAAEELSDLEGRVLRLTIGSIGLVLIVCRSALLFSTFYTLKYLG